MGGVEIPFWVRQEYTGRAVSASSYRTNELSQMNNFRERELNHVMYMRKHYCSGIILENSVVKLIGHQPGGGDEGQD